MASAMASRRASGRSACVAISPSAQPLQMNPMAVAGFIAVNPGMKRSSASTSRRPADQYENADEGCQDARRGSDRAKRVDEPRHQELVVQIRLGGKCNRVVSSSRAHQTAGYRSVSG